MAKEKKERVIRTPEQTTFDNIKTYFTKEINDQIVAMSATEMENVMKDMINTRQWIALLKYTSLRTPMLDSTLRTTDPIKDPSKISWAQGALAGVCDIETYVIDLNSPKAPEEKPEEGQPASGNPEGVIIG